MKCKYFVKNKKIATYLWCVAIFILTIGYSFIMKNIAFTNLTTFHVISIVYSVLITSIFGLLLYSFLTVSEEKIKLKATSDPITQIPNRLALYKAANRILRSSYRHNFSISLVEFEINNFKTILSNEGDSGANEALKIFSETIKKSIRGDDLIGRVGKYQFVVLLSHADLNAAEIFTDRVQNKLNDIKIYKNYKTYVSLDVSAGITTNNIFVDNDIKNMISRCEIALHKAKEFSPKKARLSYENLDYQPKIH